MLYVFAYAFPHRKTQDFLVEMKLNGINEVVVIAAPWKKLNVKKSAILIRANLQKPEPFNTATICETLGYEYVEIEHDNVSSIAELIKFDPAPIAIISGARILKRNIIELFPDGVVNFHPGMLPETAGLDAFFYTIYKKVSMGVTAHFINHQIDAGREILFKELKIDQDDTIEDVMNNLYHLQIKTLRSFLKLLKSSRIDSTEIVRPSKNLPMKDDLKIEVLESYSSWKAETIRRQLGSELLIACASADVEEIEKILNQDLSLIEYKNLRGWTPLIVSAFNQHLEVVKLLIKLGADPNATNINGTTVLMYAKTKLLNEAQPDFSILSTLIQAGAKIFARDIYGKTVIDYCSQHESLHEYFVGVMK